MHVLDYFAAGGYYTELMSRVVGPNGKVIAYNNPEYLKFSARRADQALRQQSPAERRGSDDAGRSCAARAASLDAVLFVQTYHDLYWRPKDGSWPKTDPAKALAQLVPALKPGAVVVVVDHVANAGGDPAESVDAMHRIDPAIIKRDFEAAGLMFEAKARRSRNSGGRSHEGSVRRGDPPQDGSGDVQVQEELSPTEVGPAGSAPWAGFSLTPTLLPPA